MVMLRKVVTEGTASLGEVPGYAVGGKTGTADKPTPRGGYYEDKVIATFAAVFPVHAPRYVLVVTLDEPVGPRATSPPHGGLDRGARGGRDHPPWPPLLGPDPRLNPPADWYKHVAIGAGGERDARADRGNRRGADGATRH
jgi:hypothetical protein